MDNNKTVYNSLFSIVFNIYWYNFSTGKFEVDIIQSIVGSLAQ